MYIYVGELKKTFCRNVFINKYVFNDDYPISLSLYIYIYRERDREKYKKFFRFWAKKFNFPKYKKKTRMFCFSALEGFFLKFREKSQ